MENENATMSQEVWAVLDPSPRAVARAAFLASALNLAAALALLVALQPGLPSFSNGILGRLDYVRGQTVFWWSGWLLWHAAALGLLGFYVGLAGLWRRQAPIRCGLALLCAAAGLAADLSAEALYMGLAPRLGVEGFGLAEAAAGLLTGYVGNGLYTVAGALLTWAGAPNLPKYLVALAIPVWLAGSALAAATLLDSVGGQFWSTAVLMPTFVVWTALTRRWLLQVRGGDYGRVR